MSVATTVWMITAAVVMVTGQDTDYQHLSVLQPQQFSDDPPQQARSSILPDHEDGKNFHNNSLDSQINGGSGLGKSRQQSELNRQNFRVSGGRRRQNGRGLRQSGGGRKRGEGRRHQESGSGNIKESTNNHNSDGNRDSTSSLVPDSSQSHSNAVIMLLQRLGERLTGIEILQRQQSERITTINYRLAQLELRAEEHRSITSDLGNAVRHKMETTDTELDQVNEHLDAIKISIKGLGHQYSDLKATVAGTTTEHGGETRTGVSGLKIEALMGAVQELKTSTNQVRDNVQHLTRNLTVINKIANNLTHIAEKMVTKEYLFESLNDLRSQESSASLLAKMIILQQPSTPRRTSIHKATPSVAAEDCWQLMRQGKNVSGVYSIQPRYSLVPFFVYCDMETDGGGWTVIQRREDGSVDFLREWTDYKHGFGNVAGEYWLGNEKIHSLTSHQVSELRVDLADFDQQVGHALYSAFAIGPEQEGYSLKLLGEYSGDAGDSLRYHVGQRFSTLDVDNDAYPDRSCARDHMGAWWYRACETSNLNGRYLHGPMPPDHHYTGLYWYDFRGPQYSLWKSLMMIRRGGKVHRPVFKGLADDHNQTTRVSRVHETPRVTTSPDNFDPNQDPYMTFEYPNI